MRPPLIYHGDRTIARRFEEMATMTLRDSALTLVAALLAYLEIDDIMTGSETNFVTEWVALGCVAVWAVIVAVRLFRNGHRVLATITIVLIAVGAAAQPYIGRKTDPSLRIEHVATLAAWLWLVALGGIVGGLAWRSKRLQGVKP